MRLICNLRGLENNMEENYEERIKNLEEKVDQLSLENNYLDAKINKLKEDIKNGR